MAETTNLKLGAVNSLSAKLRTFAQTLPDQERDVLGWILSRSQRIGTELSDQELESVAGGQSTPLATQLADAVGFSNSDMEVGESTIGTTWTYKF